MMKWSTLVVRWALGFMFLFNGINMFMQFMPLLKPGQSELAHKFLTVLGDVGYFYPIIGIVTLLTAVSLISNRFLPLFLIIKFPITLNGILFHLRMDPVMAPLAVAVGLMQIYLIFVNREKYLPMLADGKK